MSVYFMNRPNRFSSNSWIEDYLMDDPTEQWWPERQRFSYYQPNMYRPHYYGDQQPSRNVTLNGKNLPHRNVKKNFDGSIPIEIVHENNAIDADETAKPSEREMPVQLSKSKPKSKKVVKAKEIDLQRSSEVPHSSSARNIKAQKELLENERTDIETEVDASTRVLDAKIENDFDVSAASAQLESSTETKCSGNKKKRSSPDDKMECRNHEHETADNQLEAIQRQSEDELTANAEKLCAEARKHISTALEGLESLEAEVKKFTGSSKEKTYLRLEHELTKKILNLDKVVAAGTNKENEIRSERKSAINRIQRALDILENNVLDGSDTNAMEITEKSVLNEAENTSLDIPESSNTSAFSEDNALDIHQNAMDTCK